MKTLRYAVRHSTVYKYALPVTISHHLARLTPRNTACQQISNAAVTLSIPASSVTEGRDCFGNKTTFFVVEEPHTEMAVVSCFEAEVYEKKLPDFSKTPTLDEVRGFIISPKDKDSLEASLMSFPSRFAPVLHEVRDYAAESIRPDRPVLEAAEDLTRRIYRDFKYDPSATSIATPVNEVLTLRRGVCQDFAHLAISCFRSFGLPARYVSGYVRTYRDPSSSASAGDIAMVGADASHAWFSVFVPELGWIDFDPTNDKVVQTEHITIGWGRDFDDLSPVKGVMLGGGDHTISVDVSVVSCD